MHFIDLEFFLKEPASFLIGCTAELTSRKEFHLHATTRLQDVPFHMLLGQHADVT